MSAGLTTEERAAALWRLKAIMVFVGLPGIVLIGASIMFNVMFADQLGRDPEDAAKLTVIAVAVSVLISGIPVAMEYLRAEIRTIAFLLWLGCFLFSFISGVVYATNDDNGLGLWGRGNVVFLAVLAEFGAVGALLIVGKSVSAILAPPVEAVPVETPQDEPAESLEPSPLAQVNPEMGWNMWFQSCVTAANGQRVLPKDAYTHYENWAAMNNVTALLPMVTFGRRMTDAVQALGGRVGRSQGRYYEGITLTQLGANGAPLLGDQSAGE